jgi:hypothetical protein
MKKAAIGRLFLFLRPQDLEAGVAAGFAAFAESFRQNRLIGQSAIGDEQQAAA